MYHQFVCQFIRPVNQCDHVRVCTVRLLGLRVLCVYSGIVTMLEFKYRPCERFVFVTPRGQVICFAAVVDHSFICLSSTTRRQEYHNAFSITSQAVNLTLGGGNAWTFHHDCTFPRKIRWCTAVGRIILPLYLTILKTFV